MGKTGKTEANGKLRAAREKRRLSREEMAEQLGVGAASIVRWEEGAYPNRHNRQLLCDFFGKSPKELGLIMDQVTDTSSEDEDEIAVSIPDDKKSFPVSNRVTEELPSKDMHITGVQPVDRGYHRPSFLNRLNKRIVWLGVLTIIVLVIFIISQVFSQGHHMAITQTTPTTTPKSAVVYTIGWFDNTLHALRASDGQELWSSVITSAQADEMVTFANGTLFFSAGNHTIYAISALSHTVLWHFKTDGILNSPPLIAANIVYIGSWDGYMYALNARDGSLKWRYHTKGEIHTSPTIVNGLLIFGSTDYNVYALHIHDGSIGWIYRTDGFVVTPPVVANGIVYIGSGDHHVYALNASNGSQLWSFGTEQEIITGATVEEGVVFICSGSYLYELQAKDGALLRQIPVGERGGARPLVSAGVIYVCSIDINGYVYAFDAKDGRLLWKYQINGFMGAKPVLYNDTLYVSGSTGLYALNPHEGSLKWQFVESGAMTAPVIG